MHTQQDYPLLPKSYKCSFPFRICTTSFIYRADYIPNVKRVGPFVDEIELLLLESGKASLPDKSVIKELAGLSEALDVTYNIHLPTDISPGSADSRKRQSAVDALKQVFDLTQVLAPTTYTLHLPKSMDEKVTAEIWRGHIHACLDQLVDKVVPGEKISVETLFYPFDQVAPVIDAFQLSVCLDLGHLILCGYDVARTFNTWLDKTTIIHFHGVDGKKDHVSLERMDTTVFNGIMNLMSRFKGVLSIEVFSFEDLKSSLSCIEKYPGV